MIHYIAFVLYICIHIKKITIPKTTDRMAEIDKFIPFILKWEAGTERKEGETLEELFGRAKKKGWSDSPKDSGGATMCGVTLSTLSTYHRMHRLQAPGKDDLRSITYTRWKDILTELFWNRVKASQITSQSVAEICTDWAWASGTSGIKGFQRAVGVQPDGVVGPVTLAALNSPGKAEKIFSDIRDLRVNFCLQLVAKRPKDNIHLKGWLNRIQDLTFRD